MLVPIASAPITVREVGGAYQPSGDAARQPGRAEPGVEPYGSLGLTIDAMWEQRLDELDDRALSGTLQDLQSGMDQLEVLRGRLLMAVRERRAAARAAAGRPAISERAQDREMREQLVEQLGMSGPEAARVHRQTKSLAEVPEEVAAALREGRIRPEQAQVIADASGQLQDHPGRDALVAELLDAAATQDAVALGRWARRRIAELDPQEPEKQAERNRETRRASFRQDPDGSVRFSGQVWGLEAERLLTGIRAFTRPDTPDNPRNGGQRTADALDDLVAAALERGTAPTEHGVRPQLLILIPWETLVQRKGMAEGVHTGPLPFSELSHLLDDAALVRCLLDSDGAPIEASMATRTVSAALWWALVARDRGCRWPHCDAPPGFCDVAHGAIAHRDGGRLTPTNSLLLCRTHHRKFDRSGTAVEIDGDRVTFFRPDGTQIGTSTSPRPPGARRAGRWGPSGASATTGAGEPPPDGPDPQCGRSKAVPGGGQSSPAAGVPGGSDPPDTRS